MQIQEFPKALYRNGDYTEVQDEAGEDAQRAEGFTDWHTDQARMSAATDDKTEDEPAELTAAQLKAELTERGIEFKGNASKAALQALLDEASQ